MPAEFVLEFQPPQSTKLARSLAVLASSLLLAFGVPAAAQSAAAHGPQPLSETASIALPDAPLPQSADPIPSSGNGEVTLRNTPLHILKDQAAIWSSPARIRNPDLVWLVPLTLASAVAVTADHQTMSSVVPRDPLFNHRNVQASDVLTGGFIAAPVALIGIGQLHANRHAMESGILSGEALVDGVAVEQGLKLIFWRERPSQDQAKGKFFQRSAGIDSSFPSSHSVLAWSSAAVLAEEYPSPWLRITAYALATGVSVTRVLGQEHFPSDVLVGSAVGWLAGHYVYRKRHKIRVK